MTDTRTEECYLGSLTMDTREERVNTRAVLVESKTRSRPPPLPFVVRFFLARRRLYTGMVHVREQRPPPAVVAKMASVTRTGRVRPGQFGSIIFDIFQRVPRTCCSRAPRTFFYRTFRETIADGPSRKTVPWPGELPRYPEWT